LASVEVEELHTAEASSSFNGTKVKYSTKKLSRDEKSVTEYEERPKTYPEKIYNPRINFGIERKTPRSLTSSARLN
jgi:hypothetical protein